MFEGFGLDSPVLMNVCSDVLDGYIVFRGSSMSFLAIATSKSFLFNAKIKIVHGGKFAIKHSNIDYVIYQFSSMQ